jgi:hypothetical protein
MHYAREKKLEKVHGGHLSKKGALSQAIVNMSVACRVRLRFAPFGSENDLSFPA